MSITKFYFQLPSYCEITRKEHNMKLGQTLLQNLLSLFIKHWQRVTVSSWLCHGLDILHGLGEHCPQFHSAGPQRFTCSPLPPCCIAADRTDEAHSIFLGQLNEIGCYLNKQEKDIFFCMIICLTELFTSVLFWGD